MISKRCSVMLFLIVVVSILFVITFRVEFKMKQEYVLKGNFPLPTSDLRNLNLSICDIYIHNKKEFDNYKLWLQKKYLVDVSRLPKTFDWKKYCIYESVFFKLLEVSYNPIIKKIFLTDSEMNAPGEIYSGWLKFADVSVENRLYIYIGEKIPYRADGRDKFYGK